MFKKFLILSIILTFCLSCATWRMERKLTDGDIVEWYKLHNQIMRSKVPQWIDAENVRENVHFLRLGMLFPGKDGKKLQRVYANRFFWQIRQEGLKDVFYNRLAYANRHFDEGKPGWRTDRGRIFMLVGYPQHIQVYGMTENGYVMPEMNWDTPKYPRTFMEWWYYYHGHMVVYIFKFELPNTWRNEFLSAGGQGNLVEFERWLQEEFWAPTIEGWDLWASYLKIYLNGVKNKDKS